MSSLTPGVKGNRSFIRKKFMQHRAAGERLNASHYKMDVIGYPNLSVKIASTQLPGLERELIETYGCMGVQSNFQGNLKNAGEITFVIEETIKGDTLKDLIKIINNKEYVDIDIAMTPEDLGGSEILTCEMLECSLAFEAIDVANESVTEIVKPSVTARYNWVDRK